MIYGTRKKDGIYFEIDEKSAKAAYAGVLCIPESRADECGYTPGAAKASYRAEVDKARDKVEKVRAYLNRQLDRVLEWYAHELAHFWDFNNQSLAEGQTWKEGDLLVIMNEHIDAIFDMGLKSITAARYEDEEEDDE